MLLIRLMMGWLCVVVLAACSGEAQPLREWQPSDHAQPPNSQIDPNRVRGSERPEISVAELLWQKHCARCHGSEGRGGAEATIDFSAAEVQARLSDSAIASTIANGKPPMPAFAAELDASQIEELVAYVRQFGGKSEPQRGATP